MHTIRVAFCTGFAWATILLPASSVWAQESVDLKPRFQAGSACFIETQTEAKSKSTTPMGDFDMTLRVKSGFVQEVSPRENGVRVIHTIDRAAFGFDSSMGPSYFDSDIPDEEQSEQWAQILAPQVGMQLTIDLDGESRVIGGAGMEAIVKKIEASAAGNMFWTYDKPNYTDEKHQVRWKNQALNLFPNRAVKPGETWTGPYVEEMAEIKDFTFNCTYTLDRVEKKDGRTLAEISFQGVVPADQTYVSSGMMPVNNIRIEKAAISGTATIDVERGEVVRRNDQGEIAYQGTMGDGDSAPKVSASYEIKRTYLIKSTEDRAAEKRENAQIAAAKKKAADEERAKIQHRFASAEAVQVDTGVRSNTVGIDESWPQWGGPRGDFKSATTGLADKWPDSGPKQLWSRDLGDGYSAIVSDGMRLYTQYRPTDEEKNKTDEHVIALDPKTGETVWDIHYAAPFVEGMDANFGRGPHSTPLIVGDRIFTIGSLVHLHCLDRNSGSILWSRDLRKDYNASHMMYGYGASALAHGDKIILPVGEKGQAVVAFNQSDGSDAWKAQDFGPTHASPFVIKTGNVEQLILFASKEIAGLDPVTGSLHWRIEQSTEWGANISTPVWGNDGRLFISSAYGMGSRGIQLSIADGKPAAKELWHNPKMKIHHSNAVRVGNFVYGSSGDFGPVFYAGVDMQSGEITWKNREVGKASSIYADGKMIILNENGLLFLAKVSPAELTLLSQFQLFNDRSWTAPTLVGKHLFVRDRHKIVALDLGS